MLDLQFGMNSTNACINCLSNNVPLLDMSTQICVQNDVDLKFIDCYKRCTATKVVPIHSRICELCCRQYKSIFNLLCKSQKPEQHPQIVTVATPEIEIIKIEDDDFKQEFTQFVGHEEIHIECVKAEPIDPVVGTTLTSVDVEETKKRLTLRCCYCPETFSWLSGMQKHFLSVHKGLNWNQSFNIVKPIEGAVESPSTLKNQSLPVAGSLINLNNSSSTVKVKRIRKDVNKFFCAHCTKGYVCASKLLRHILPVHKGIKYEPVPKSDSSNTVNGKRIRKGTKRYFCAYCPKGFLSPSGLEKHILPVHKGIKLDQKRPYMCEDCGKAFPSPAKLRTHSSVHFKGIPPLACELCPKRFNHPESLRNHIKKMHSVRPDVFRCEHCPLRQKIYRCPKKFGDHQKLHDPSTACVCLTCEKSLASFNDLMDHIQIHHKATPNSLDVKCEKCNKNYITPSGLRMHVFADHFSKLFTCEFCEFSSTQMPGLKQHLWTHKKSCPFPFMCTEENCAFRTRNKTNFQHHLSKIHNITYDSKLHDMNEQQLTALMKEQEKIGLKSYLPKKQFNKINTTQPWKCKQCPRTFSHSGNLSRHVNILHKNLNYECKFCDCQYNSPQGIWLHSFKHRDGIKPFNCPSCKYKTTLKAQFKKHLAKRHEITYDEKKHGYKVPPKEVLEFIRKKRDLKDDVLLNL